MDKLQNIRYIQNLLLSINKESLSIQSRLTGFNTNDDQLSSTKNYLNDNLLLLSQYSKQLKFLINNHLNEIEKLNDLMIFLNKNLESTTVKELEEVKNDQPISGKACIDTDGSLLNLP